MHNILIVEDEKDIVEAIEYNLKKEDYKIFKAYDGRNGLKTAQEKLPDLIILDLMLPEISGLDVCRALKKDDKTSNIPIIMLTAKSSEVDRIIGLELGADDYITKPFSMRELIARIKTILKRTSSEKKGSEETTTEVINFKDLEIDSDKHQVKVARKDIKLTAKEFSLLRHLAENKGRVFSREKLLDTVWGVEVAIETRTVDVHIRRLRKKLGKAGKYILTLRGVGYKFNA